MLKAALRSREPARPRDRRHERQQVRGADGGDGAHRGRRSGLPDGLRLPRPHARARSGRSRRCATPTGLDLLDSLDLYRARGIDLRKVVLGLPTYGMTWPTIGPEPNAERARIRPLRRRARDHLPSRAHPSAAVRRHSGRRCPETRPRASRGGTRSWAPGGRPTWTHRPPGGPSCSWRTEADLAGIGIWALGYDGGAAGLPGHDRRGAGATGRGGRLDRAGRGRGRWMCGSAPRCSTCSPPPRWVQLSNDGLAWSPPLPPDAVRSVAWRLAAGDDGPRTVLVRTRDTAGCVVEPVRVGGDRGPHRPGHRGPRPDGGGRRMARQLGVTDATGVEQVRIRHRVGDGAGRRGDPSGPQPIRWSSRRTA